MDLSWTASSIATGGYHVKRATIGGGPYTTIATNPTGTSYADTGLANGTVYYYVVSAIGSGLESLDSLIVSARPVSTDPAPIGLGISNGIIQVSWPIDHIGWRLLSKTNLLDPEWVEVSGSSAGNVIESTMSVSNNSVFYRIVYP